MTESPRLRPRDLLAALAAFLLVCAVFGKSVRYDFVGLDDDRYLLENPHVSGGLTAEGVRWAFQVAPPYQFYPLTWLSHMLDFELFGARPAGHHAVSVALHAASTGLLYLLLAGTAGHRGCAALAAILFGIHPLRVQSVVWVSERKDVLSLFLALATLAAYAWSARSPRSDRRGLVAALFALGLLAKPMLVTLPVGLLLLDAWPLRRVPLAGPARAWLAAVRPLVVEKLPLLALSLAAGLVTVFTQKGGGGLSANEMVPLGTRVANAVTGAAWYLEKTVWPSRLAVYYPLEAPSAMAVAASAVLLSLLLASAWRLRDRCPELLVGLLWFLVTLAPVSGLVQVGGQQVADRYSYLPSLLLVAGVVYGTRSLLGPRRRALRLLAAGGAAQAALFAVLTWFEADSWKDSRTLFRSALEVTRGNWLMHFNLGNTLAAEGDVAGAERHYRAALSLRPGWEQPVYTLSRLLLSEGRLEETRALLETSLAANPRSPGLCRIAAAGFGRTGDRERSRELLLRALSLESAAPGVRR